MSTMTDIQSKAREAFDWFEVARRATGDTETGPREDGDEYTRVKDGAPEWVSDLVYKAHGDFLPDDFRYDAIVKALEWISDEEDEDGDSYEFAYTSVDVYTGRLTAWLASNLNRVGYCDEASEELGPSDSIVESITRGQAVEYAEVYASVRHSLEQS